MKLRGKPNRDALYRTAEQQAGYFTARQGAAAGFSAERLSSLAQLGRIQRLARGIYRLRHFPASRFEDLFVAWLRCGPRSVISHHSALSLFDLSDVIPSQVHVTIPRSGSRRRPGIRLHTGKLPRSSVTMREGLPVTSVPRTIADVARFGMASDHVQQAVQDALRRGLVTPEALRKEARRGGGRTWRLIGPLLLRQRAAA